MTAAIQGSVPVAAAGEALIELKGIRRDYDDGAVTALRDIDIAVRPGEFVAVVGPSGSGKSSLLNIMAGIDLPTSGRAFWRGREVAGRGAWTELRRAQIGIVFQDFLLLPTLTALENVAIAMTGAGVVRTKQSERAAELLAAVGLSGRLHHLPHALSGGERQRVAIARAIANRPQLLLCDEPTGNLDSAAAATVVELLVELRRAHGIALVLVTHDLSLAGLAERRVAMRDGRVVTGDAGAGVP